MLGLIPLFLAVGVYVGLLWIAAVIGGNKND